MSLQEIIQKIPIGYSEISYRDRRYALTRQDLAGGRSIKVFARELGGTDFISFNFYRTSNSDLLKPCEMSEEKVMEFLLNKRPVGRKA